jgi:signal peptidase I
MTTLATARRRRTRPDAARRRPGAKDSVWAWLWYGISAALLALILGIGVVAIALPRLTGSVPLTVLSASMEPALPPGTMLVVRPLARDQMSRIRIGDVISYQPNPLDPTLVTHRVVGITSLQDGSFVFTTRGDANAEADPPVRSLQVRARLWYAIPGLGWVTNVVNAQGNRAWIIPTAAGLLFAYAGYTAAAGVDAHRRRRAQGGRRGPAD